MFKWLLPTVMAVIAGLLVLLGYLIPSSVLGSIRTVLVQWATVLAAFALLLAYGNILRVHLGRLFQKRAKHRIASLILIVSAVAALVLVLLQGADGVWIRTWVRVVLAPGQSALLALTAVTLTLAGIKLLRVRRTIYSVIFVIVALIMLLSAMPIAYPPVAELIVETIEAAATGGMRGLLIGVVLGIVLTGLRVILGIDRPHSGG